MSDVSRDRDGRGEAPPPEIPDLDLIRAVGRGGFGRVWLATNRTTGRLCAVKVIPLRPPGTADPAGREITSITRLEANLRRRHPSLLAIHHVGKTADHLFYVMDAADDVSGARASSAPGYRPATLESRLEKGPLAPDDCWRCARRILAGLASLHEAGMVHRDVKPSNCLFVDGDLKLADFGLVTEATPQVSRVGTRAYMPPDGHMDARADVYAAGLVIYEMITGLPAAGFPRLDHQARVVVENPRLNTLARLCLRACQPDPGERFRDARRMLAEVVSEPATTRAPRFRRRVAAAACLLGAAVVALVALWPGRDRRVDVNFITEEPFFEATIYLDGQPLKMPNGGDLYTTPCTVDDLPARAYDVVFKIGEDREIDAGRIDFATVRQVVVRQKPGS
ncbi:MAG: serine/threonine-protein kinase [Planctomycetota bacterium]|jgi:serine/threonine protein kinase